MSSLYPPITPYHKFKLSVNSLHNIYVEESGNPKGKPVIFLHGGPGGGTEPIYRQYFNPDKWRIILFDQRGCGRSTPHAELKENTTWDLIKDIEKIRKKLKIDNWVVFGGSWGSTLGLTYAITYPQVCSALVLRGIFLLRKKEIKWFYQEGCSYIFPDAWEKYLSPIPLLERDDMVKAYYKRLTSDIKEIRLEAAKSWATWEASTSRLIQTQKALHSFDNDKVAEAFSRIECHYFINGGFFAQDNWILDNVTKICNIPMYIVQGRYDVVCPFDSAWNLYKKVPEAHFYIIPDAGHSMLEQGIQKKLIEITDTI